MALTIIVFILVLAVLIFVHELGHFIFALACGIRVDEFKIGFGPRIFSWKKGETDYGINLIPFGGYVKIHGENPDEEGKHDPDSHRSFVNKNRFKQCIVLLAGILFNFIFAWILYSIVLSSGVTVNTDGFDQYANKFENERTMITYVASGSPADKAGLKAGDSVPNMTVEELQNYISSSKGAPITIHYSENGNDAAAQVVPVTGIVEGKYGIGVSLGRVAELHLGFVSAIREGFNYMVTMIRETASGLFTFIVNIFRGTANFSDVSGPVGIAGIVGSAAEMGWTYLFMITALISINLGVINLVPFPALDGGRTLFVIIEAITRKRIPAKIFNIINGIGFALLMLLMIIVTYKDIAKLVK